MSLKYNKSYKVVLCAVIMVIWVSCAIGNYIKNLTKIETEAAREKLISSTEHNADEINLTFQRYINSLNVIAVMLQDSIEYHSPGTMEMLQKVSATDGYEQIAIDTIDGKSYTSDGDTLDITEFEYLDRIKKGETFVYVDTSLTNRTQSVNIIVPVINADGTHTAALQCTITIDSLLMIFNETFSNSGGYYQLIDSKGNYITITNKAILNLKKSNFFNDTDSFTFNDGTTEDQLTKSFAEQRSGFIKYTYNNQLRYAYYTPVGINDWLMVTSIPKELVEQKTSLHLTNALFMTAQIAAVLAIATAYIYISQRNAKNKILLNQKYLEALTEYSGKTMYELEIKTRKLHKLTNYNNVFDESKRENSVENELNFSLVHPDDMEKLNNMYKIAKAGKNFNDCKLRIKNKTGEYRWFNLTGISVTDTDGKPYKTITFLENINDQVLREADLSHKAERDSLTGLFNKATTELMINEILNKPENQNQSHVLMIIDVDNFKDVNDKLGHKFGDDVLIDLAENLKPLFRTDDIIGRIGGDEFFVFLKRCDSEKLIKSKAADICNAFKNTYTVDGICVSVTASIGIASFPKNGTDFNTLYKNADTALYITKEHGKNNFTMHDGVSTANYQSTRTKIDS